MMLKKIRSAAGRKTGLFFLAVFVGLVFIALPAYSLIINRMQETEGEITYCRTIEKENPLVKNSGYSTYIDVYIGYIYFVKGKRYTGKIVQKENPPDILCKLNKQGEKTSVFYSPRNPSYSTISKPNIYISIMFMLAGTIFIYTMIITAIRNKR